MQNVIDATTVAFIILTAFAVMAYLIHILKRKQLLNILPVLATMAVVFLLYRIIGLPGSAGYYNLLALDLCIAIIASIIAVFYISKPWVFIGLMVLMVAGFLIYAGSYPGDTTFAGMFAIGTILGILYREFVMMPKKSQKSKTTKKSTEINRDLVQIFLGVVLIAILYFFQYAPAVSIIFALIIIAYTTNNLLANLKLSYIYRKAMDLERKDVTYGLGATTLAASTALVMGFTHSTNLMLFGVVVLFFADSLATIVGVSMKRAAELPYNQYKTYIGTFVFFVVAAIAGFIFIGLYGVLFAVILAFIESLNLSLDDNIRSGIVIVILNALIGI
jgi:dolichol kinase